jgi:signal transduction histidine kinase
MYARLLREGRDHNDPEKRTRWLSVVEQESDRLQAMVRQMLAIAKREVDHQSGQITLIELGPLLEKLVVTQNALARSRGLEIVSHIEPDLPNIVGDLEDIYSIFKNLLDNAIKFSTGGTVEVSAQVEQSNQIVVRVRDEGIGIAQEAMPNLFKRFYRAQSAVEKGIAGTGLGLYMVQDIARQHGGSIDVDSIEGKGTTFAVRLPVAE